jgi:heme/copper-type cytochrome/quinol oxidase subunit 4
LLILVDLVQHAFELLDFVHLREKRRGTRTGQLITKMILTMQAGAGYQWDVGIAGVKVGRWG